MEGVGVLSKWMKRALTGELSITTFCDHVLPSGALLVHMGCIHRAWTILDIV
jgi:hypothetical protein